MSDSTFVSQIGRITAEGTITEFPTLGASPTSLTAGFDGALWFTSPGQIGRMTVAGSVSQFALPSPRDEPVSITRGPDGALWFTVDASADASGHAIGLIGRITPSGSMTEFPIPQPNGVVVTQLGGITTGRDGALWFTERHPGTGEPPFRIGRITTSGDLTEFSLPTLVAPENIAAGPDGSVWFTERSANTGLATGSGNIGQITMNGTITLFGLVHGGIPVDITAGPDGAVWFTEIGGSSDASGHPLDTVGKITPDGGITEFPLPGLPNEPGNTIGGITSGPDGALWFTAAGANTAGVIERLS